MVGLVISSLSRAFPRARARLARPWLPHAFLAFNAAFQHANIRTPRWLGYLIQRPESHAVHHGRGIHRWQDAPSEAGFYDGASARLGTLLTFRKVA